MSKDTNQNKYPEGELLTEKSNIKSRDLDLMSTHDLVNIFSKEDLEPQRAVAKCLPEITQAIDSIVVKLQSGGRLFYIGAGTSGRLGVLDAAECPPTFCTPPDLVQGLIAGGDSSLKNSSEALEDLGYLSVNDLKYSKFSSNDCLVGITAGGTTVYVNSALIYARKLGALTISIACVPSQQAKLPADIDIRLLTGPELLTGSTRLKAGTATKMTLNMISTIVMIRLGKVYDNKMVDLSISNKKLTNRALRIISEVAKIDRQEAEELLIKSNGSVKISLLMALTSLSISEAKEILLLYGEDLRASLNHVNKSKLS